MADYGEYGDFDDFDWEMEELAEELERKNLEQNKEKADKKGADE